MSDDIDDDEGIQSCSHPLIVNRQRQKKSSVVFFQSVVAMTVSESSELAIPPTQST